MTDDWIYPVSANFNIAIKSELKDSRIKSSSSCGRADEEANLEVYLSSRDTAPYLS
jgi:hypothetical protein